MPRVTRTCEACQEQFGTYESKGHTRCIPCRNRKADTKCQGCGAEVGRRTFCEACADARERDRWKAKGRNRRRDNSEAAKQIVGCEGCGKDTTRGSGLRRHIHCPECKRLTDAFNKDAYRRPFPFIAAVKAWHVRVEAKREASTPCHDRHVKAWREYQKRVEAAAAKPWLHPDLSAAEKYRLRYGHQRASFEHVCWDRQRSRLKKALRENGTSMRRMGVLLKDVSPCSQIEYAQRVGQIAEEAGLDPDNAAVRFRQPLSDWGAVTVDTIRSFLSFDNLEACENMLTEEYRKGREWLDVPPGRARVKARRSVDPEYDRRVRLAARVNDRMRETGKEMRKALRGKGRTTFEALGFTVADLQKHLERQFTKGMTWDKFHKGEIHIDHRVPLSSFSLTDPDEFRAAWALTNLQPLWAKDNMEKSDKRSLLL